MKRNGILLKSTVIAALIAAPVAPVLAQTAPETAPEAAPMQAAPEAPAADFSEAQLTSFIDAAMQVQDVQEDYAARIDGTAEPEGKQALVQEAQQEMASAVEETEGMDVQTYNQISAAAQADPELNERLLAMLQTKQQDGAGATMTE
ncbi:MAG: DUF4168 domain-containing protein [Salipiger thiooxidans]|uniref:DUF4168 domain-containing protein n=1 Tax=Salipiger thiooxidans TaxID=282683 RepID=UPI001A8F32C6|nr:DUF4168 domain-containing protein [Salipiger thiooxidans]MBN8187140.1 DUF4168 domain-containing protein [Salipiger thiooxidans]